MIMDDSGEGTFRLNLKDVKAFIRLLEKNEGPNRFSKAIERKLVEEFVENDWEIKSSPVPGFETNLEYLFSLIPELYRVTKELSENAEEFASSLAYLLRSCQNKNTLPIQPEKVLH
jgi:hypothetical protein